MTYRINTIGLFSVNDNDRNFKDILDDKYFNFLGSNINYESESEIDISKIFLNKEIDSTMKDYKKKFVIKNEKELGENKEKYNKKKKKTDKEKKKSLSEVLNKKRGREKSPKNKNNRRIHSVLAKDNILRKIQNKYFSFLENLANFLIKKKILNNPSFSYIVSEINNKDDYKIRKIDYKIKRNITKKNIMNLKIKTIGEILSLDVSPIVKNQKEVNKKIIEEIKNNELIKSFLNRKYSYFFEEFKKKINFEIKNGKNNYQEIYPRDIEFLPDFIKKETNNWKNKKGDNDKIIKVENYINKFKRYLEEYEKLISLKPSCGVKFEVKK